MDLTPGTVDTFSPYEDGASPHCWMLFTAYESWCTNHTNT